MKFILKNSIFLFLLFLYKLIGKKEMKTLEQMLFILSTSLFYPIPSVKPET